MQEEIRSAWTDITLKQLAEKLEEVNASCSCLPPEGITYYYRASKLMPVAVKENSRVSLNGFNG